MRLAQLFRWSLIGLGAVLLLNACGQPKTDANEVPPLVFVPGLGMSALHVEVDTPGSPPTEFNFLLPSMNPPEMLPSPATSARQYATLSGLPPSQFDSVHYWLGLDISPQGSASNRPGVSLAPVSFGKDFAAECPRYMPLAQDLETQGWVLNNTLYCAPFDYRYAPGGNTFASDFKGLVDQAVRDGGGNKVVVACHSQGCLMAYHAIRTLDQGWVKSHISLLFGLAGQFSGCSDCLRWAFQDGWSWNPNDELAATIDPTWVGELALGLQTETYGQNILYRNGSSEYRAHNAQDLLNDGGAAAMAQATSIYSLSQQSWFQRGQIGSAPLAVPSRFVFGTGLATTVGYDFSTVPVDGQACPAPSCSGSFSQSDPTAIQADGDAGDSNWMNSAPSVWTTDPACDLRGLAGVTHMGIIADEDAIGLLASGARAALLGEPLCVS